VKSYAKAASDPTRKSDSCGYLSAASATSRKRTIQDGAIPDARSVRRQLKNREPNESECNHENEKTNDGNGCAWERSEQAERSLAAIIAWQRHCACNVMADKLAVASVSRVAVTQTCRQMRGRVLSRAGRLGRWAMDWLHLGAGANLGTVKGRLVSWRITQHVVRRPNEQHRGNLDHGFHRASSGKSADWNRTM